uniref:Uncharacterized protein n=1 Tax=Anguilla anguilla TaxID=7936 RepID=A0A0E9WIA3_ANGAN
MMCFDGELPVYCNNIEMNEKNEFKEFYDEECYSEENG